VGDEIEAVILNIDREERKISLGLKQLKPDPWTTILEKYPVGSKHKGKVRNFTHFGIFVELEEGIDGLLHISDLSWTKKFKHPSEFAKTGDEIDVVILEVDTENRKLSLGHKQLQDNPWDTYETIFKPDAIIEGIVGKVTDKGATISFPQYGIEGFAPYRHLLKENGATARQDEKLPFKVIEFSKDTQKIMLSHTRTFQDLAYEKKAAEASEKEKEAESTRSSLKKIKENIEKTTLGDLDALSSLKSDLEKREGEK
jgi:small subunit ribosomal protein S1